MSAVLSAAAAFGVGLDVVRLALLASVLLYMSLLPFMVPMITIIGSKEDGMRSKVGPATKTDILKR